MKKIYSRFFLLAFATALIVVVSILHWVVFYEYDTEYPKWIWSLGFLAFLPSVIILLKVFKPFSKVYKFLLVFSVLLAAQSLADLYLINVFFGGRAKEIYSFFMCMEDSWVGNMLLSASAFIFFRNDVGSDIEIDMGVNTEILDSDVF